MEDFMKGGRGQQSDSGTSWEDGNEREENIWKNEKGNKNKIEEKEKKPTLEDVMSKES